MSRRKKLILCLLAAGVVASGWVGIRALFAMTVSTETWSECKICRAQLHEEKRIFRSPRSEITENEFSRYYRKEADPAHQHDWQWTAGSSTDLRGLSMCGDGAVPAGYLLHDDAALAVVRSLPDRHARKTFIETVCRRLDYDSPNRAQAEAAVRKLIDAYAANPSRKDWTKLLKKVGLSPL